MGLCLIVLEARNLKEGGLVAFEGHEERSILGLSPWLVSDCLLPVSSLSLPAVYVCAQISSSCEGTSHIVLGLTLMTSFSLNYSCKYSITK